MSGKDVRVSSLRHVFTHYESLVRVLGTYWYTMEQWRKLSMHVWGCLMRTYAWRHTGAVCSTKKRRSSMVFEAKWSRKVFGHAVLKTKSAWESKVPLSKGIFCILSNGSCALFCQDSECTYHTSIPTSWGKDSGNWEQNSRSCLKQTVEQFTAWLCSLAWLGSLRLVCRQFTDDESVLTFLWILASGYLFWEHWWGA